LAKPRGRKRSARTARGITYRLTDDPETLDILASYIMAFPDDLYDVMRARLPEDEWRLILELKSMARQMHNDLIVLSLPILLQQVKQSAQQLAQNIASLTNRGFLLPIDPDIPGLNEVLAEEEGSIAYHLADDAAIRAAAMALLKLQKPTRMPTA
jgi:hypothetical protein